MSVSDLYSKRKAALAGTTPVLQTEHIPGKLRVQVGHLAIAAVGRWVNRPHFLPYVRREPANEVWESIQTEVTREHGRPTLTPSPLNPLLDCLDYICCAPTDDAVDAMEVVLRHIDWVVRGWGDPQRREAGSSQSPDSAIAEFNVRCRENGVGLAYEQGRIIPVSSTYVHTQVVEPALALLQEAGFEGALAEFFRAHLHLRRGEWEAAIVEAGKAFESAMKTVCGRMGWPLDPGAQAKHLVAALLKNGVLPHHQETQLAHLRGLLETGVPVVRNKEGAHGRGEDRVGASREVAEYAVHLTAANIVFLVGRLRAAGGGA